MPRVKSETIGTGDQSWLRSDHGIGNCLTLLLDISAFSSTDNYSGGYIPSGTPVSVVGGMLVPYTSAEATTTGAGILYGHLFSDQVVVGTNDFAVPYLPHGTVVAAKVPMGTDAFTAPAAAAKRTKSSIIYV